MNQEILDELIRHIQKTSERHAKIDDEDFDISGYCGGNYDDAYYMGSDDGEILYARELLKKMEEKHD